MSKKPDKKADKNKKAAKDLANDDIGEENRLKMYRMMNEMRLMEKRAHDLFLQNLVKGTSHLGIGQEAIATGFGVSMKKGDYTYCTYRGHNHVLARGASIEGILGELMGRECGLLHGKGGSMHLTSAENGHMGSYAIIGAQLCIALGSAWKSQYKDDGGVTTVFFGDGTTNIGTFHEAVNYAAVFKLPVIFVCENNLYMEYTAIDKVTPVEHPAADRSPAYSLDKIVIDGNDADEVYRTAQKVYERARKGDGPSLVEAKTYRHGGHSRADPAKYRPDGELEEWMKRDPLPTYRERLLEFGVKKDVVDDIEKQALKAVDDATEAAKESPPPSKEIAFTNVWANGGWEWRN